MSPQEITAYSARLEQKRQAAAEAEAAKQLERKRAAEERQVRHAFRANVQYACAFLRVVAYMHYCVVALVCACACTCACVCVRGRRRVGVLVVCPPRRPAHNAQAQGRWCFAAWVPFPLAPYLLAPYPLAPTPSAPGKAGRVGGEATGRRGPDATPAGPIGVA